MSFHMLSAIQYCPLDYPYAINNGASCCRHYKKNQTACSDLGLEISLSDPPECCKFGEVQDCSSTEGCNDNPYAQGEHSKYWTKSSNLYCHHQTEFSSEEFLPKIETILYNNICQMHVASTNNILIITISVLCKEYWAHRIYLQADRIVSSCCPSEGSFSDSVESSNRSLRTTASSFLRH